MVSQIFCFSAKLTKLIEVMFPTTANNQHHHSAFHQNLERAVKSVGANLFHQRNKSTTESCPSLSCCENIIIYFHSVSSLFDLSSLHPNGFIHSDGETHVMNKIRFMREMLGKWIELPSARLHCLSVLLCFYKLCVYIHQHLSEMCHIRTPLHFMHWLGSSRPFETAPFGKQMLSSKKMFCLPCISKTNVSFKTLHACAQRVSQHYSEPSMCTFTIFSYLSSFLRNSNKGGEHRDTVIKWSRWA